MRTLKAVLWGFLVTTALILAGGWAATLLVAPGVRGQYYPATLAAGLLALFYSGASIAIGAYVATRIHDTNETASGFIVAQAFFGFGLIRAFWIMGSSWYTVTAVLLVIPGAIVGRSLAQRLGSGNIARVA
ncbi:MAG TPA: hypothetical protein VGJ62_01925 [Gemmatimonadaceae bacterium]|jgi:hypothetical protein